MTSAVSQVLSTPELLELILTHLPLPTLLLSQRVCSTFNNLITTSPTLQHALFLCPGSSASTRGRKWTVNPLLRKHFLPFFLDRSHSPSVLELLDWNDSIIQRSAFLRREASWRRMALTSQDSHTLRIARRVQDRNLNSFESASLPASVGITMGAIYDIVQSWRPAQRDAYFEFFVEEDKEDAGKMCITLYFSVLLEPYRDSQGKEIKTSLRSEGEEVTMQTLEWRDAAEEDKNAINDYFSRRTYRLNRDTTGRERADQEWKKWEGKRQKARRRGVAVDEVSDIESEHEDWWSPEVCRFGTI